MQYSKRISYHSLTQLYPHVTDVITPKYSPKHQAIEDPLCV
jgi:hypothetical protein